MKKKEEEEGENGIWVGREEKGVRGLYMCKLRLLKTRKQTLIRWRFLH